MATDNHTEYAVARGNEIITEWSDSLAEAIAAESAIVHAMHVAQLEPDVHVVESDVDITTKRSRARAYVAPEGAEQTASSEPSDGSGYVLPKSGIYGDESGAIGRKNGAAAAIEPAPGESVPHTTIVGEGSTEAPQGGTQTASSDVPSGAAADGTGGSIVVGTDGGPL